MNRYMHAGICLGISIVKCALLKIVRKKSFSCSLVNLISPRTELTLDKGGSLSIGKMLRLRSGAKIRVRKNATVILGENFSMSNGCMLVAWEKIEIGDNVQFGPGVLVYDQDHDYTADGGLTAEKYKTSPVKIGDNVWVGANAIILRGSVIGNNCVVAAGSVIKGVYPDNTLVFQKRETMTRTIHYEENR